MTGQIPGDMQNEYDQVAYPSAVYPQTHPDRLATIGRLHGMPVCPIDQARILELGCGDGMNLVAMACGLPQSQFVGVDLAAEPIHRGQVAIGELHQQNVSLHQQDVANLPGELGQFDYIIAHGLFSWVPPAVRDSVLAVCHERLNPGGVAYISYNAYPGNHQRDAIRHMIRLHTQGFENAREKIQQAKALVKFAVDSQPNPGAWQRLLQNELDRITGYLESGFFHDDLGPINHSLYFHEFVEHAARHQLQFLAEADFSDMQPLGLTEAAAAMLRQIEQRSLVAREQYLDFLKGRAFRQTLLCHASQTLDRALKPDRVADLFVAGEIAPVNPAQDLSDERPEDFQGPRKSLISARHPLAKAALLCLGEAFPHRLPFAELCRAAAQRSGHPTDAAANGQPARDLAQFVIRAYEVGFLDLHIQPEPFLTRLSDRPGITPLARWQIDRQDTVCTLRHTVLKAEDFLTRNLLKLLDGTRDRAALLADLSELARQQTANPQDPATAIPSPQPGQLEVNLRHLLRNGLLIC